LILGGASDAGVLSDVELPPPEKDPLQPTNIVVICFRSSISATALFAAADRPTKFSLICPVVQ
jgi:uroporphyrinogen-III synthase